MIAHFLFRSVETQENFSLGTWNEDNFTMTGIEIETLSDGGFRLQQQKFVDQLELTSLSQRRSREDSDKLTPSEFTQLRAVSGSANWLANQTRPDLCASTPLLQSAHASATVADTREANRLPLPSMRAHIHFVGAVCQRFESSSTMCFQSG